MKWWLSYVPGSYFTSASHPVKMHTQVKVWFSKCPLRFLQWPKLAVFNTISMIRSPIRPCYWRSLEGIHIPKGYFLDLMCHVPLIHKPLICQGLESLFLAHPSVPTVLFPFMGVTVLTRLLHILTETTSETRRDCSPSSKLSTKCFTLPCRIWGTNTTTVSVWIPWKSRQA